jgi:formimidoylglutamate deiminase
VTSYFAGQALLPEGWAKDVRIDVDDAGSIAAVVPGASSRDCTPLAGPVLPGMANLHSHAFQRAMAGLTEVRGPGEDDFWTWRELMYRFVARLAPAEARAIAEHLYIELLRHGYTAVAEFHYVHNAPDSAPYDDPATLALAHLEAARSAGIAFTCLPSLYAHSNFGRRALRPQQARFRSDPALIVRIAQGVQRAAQGHPDVAVGVAPHSLRAVAPAELSELIEASRALGENVPIHIHAAEQQREVEDCIAWSVKRPVEWLLESAEIDARWCVVHATHMTRDEAAALARSGATVALCPTTEANLGDGVFPLAQFRAAGGRYGIGGDSHVSRDPAEELRLLEYAQRLLHRRRNLAAGPRSSAVGTTLWLEAAAGGRALGRAMGAIAPGLRADLVVLEGAHPDLAARSGDALANALVFSGATDLVRDVMVGGKWAVREARHPRQDEAAASFRRALQALLA